MTTIRELQQQIATFQNKAATYLIEMQCSVIEQNFLKAESLKKKAAAATKSANNKAVILAGAKQAALVSKIAEVNAIIAEFDIQPEQLKFNVKEDTAPKKEWVKTIRIKQNAGTTKTTTKGMQVEAKYRNPANGKTWAGRGRRPKWLTAALLNGADITAFLIHK